MLSDTPRNTLTLKFKSDIRNPVHWTTKLTDIKPQDLSRRNINNCIQNEWLRQWNTQLSNGMCPYALFPILTPEHCSTTHCH